MTALAARRARVVDHCRQLLRRDTSNPGRGEVAAARYVQECLRAVQARMVTLEPEPGRCSVISRMECAARHRSALLLHGHLDVVPAAESEWTVAPFGGCERDGALYGRGAVDMKHMLAMMLTAQEEIAHGSLRPRRTVVFAYLADEEEGGALGSRFLVARRPELLDGVTDALGEGGGYVTSVQGDRTNYAITYAERGVAWAKIRIPGRVSEPSLARLGAQLARLEAYTRDVHGAEIDLTPTMVEVTREAETILSVDCRVPPHGGQDGLALLQTLLEDDMTVDVVMSGPGCTAPRSGHLVATCARALREVVPAGRLQPSVFPAGSDAEQISQLGIRCYGFTPLVTHEPFDLWRLAHRPDERVPVDALQRGYEVLRNVLALV